MFRGGRAASSRAGASVTEFKFDAADTTRDLKRPEAGKLLLSGNSTLCDCPLATISPLFLLLLPKC